MSEDITLRKNDILVDSLPRSEGRRIKLIDRVNPAGKNVKPYWQVENVDTGRRTTIREDLITGARWTHEGHIVEVTADNEPS